MLNFNNRNIFKKTSYDAHTYSAYVTNIHNPNKSTFKTTNQYILLNFFNLFKTMYTFFFLI